MGENCVVCGMSFPQREHVARHFQDELLEITKTFDSPLSCAFCPFTADRVGKSTPLLLVTSVIARLANK